MENKKRLIDVSPVIRDLTAMKSVYDAIALDGIIKALKEAPTVDAVEVVHGRWIHKGAWHIECSECQYILAHIGEAKNYCPNCGAKMDGGNDQ